MVEGVAGEHYQLRLHGEPVRVATGPATTRFADDINYLSLSFPSGSGRETVAIQLESGLP
jgi:hypothetical protein